MRKKNKKLTSTEKGLIRIAAKTAFFSVVVALGLGCGSSVEELKSKMVLGPSPVTDIDWQVSSQSNIQMVQSTNEALDFEIAACKRANISECSPYLKVSCAGGLQCTISNPNTGVPVDPSRYTVQVQQAGAGKIVNITENFVPVSVLDTNQLVLRVKAIRVQGSVAYNFAYSR